MKKLKIFLEMIKFEHTIFALPFAYMGAVLGSVIYSNTLPSWADIVWITLAMIGARTAGMALNRVIDRTIDALNPRTSNRAIPAGLMKTTEAWLFIILSFGLLFLATSQLDPLAMKLLPIAVIMLVGYSYMKRITWLCHVFLGLTNALAALGGWVAVTGQVNMAGYVFYVTIALWIAGFDILYACQDTEFDRDEKLHSIPSRFGIRTSLWIAKSFHMLTGAGMLALLLLTDLSWWYAAGMLIAYAILFYEHRLVSPTDLSKLNTAFFTMNGILAVIVFLFTFIDVVVQL
jgi:4-hydroxybenzoate polyprenyltransferase